VHCVFVPVATQSHRSGCDGTAPVTPDPDPEWEAMGFIACMERRKAQRDVENVRRYYDPDAIHEWLGTKPPAAATISRPRPVDIAQPGANPVYVTAAIRDELATLAATTKGSRNDTLNIVALKVFGFVKAGHADKRACWDELKRIGSAIGLTDTEMVGFDGAHGTLGSAWKGATPRQVPSQVTEL
jgi:hypothetical protein